MPRLSAALIAVGALLAVGQAREARAIGDTEIRAGDCSVAGVGAKANTVTCNFGLTPEQVRDLTEAAVRGATVPLVGAIGDLSRKLGITEDATKTLLRIVGEQDVPLERLSETLARVATDYKRLQAQAAALKPENPVARDLVERAKAEIGAGRFGKAHELLDAARQAQLAAAAQARQLREQAHAAELAQLRGAATATAVEGELAVTEGSYLQAAELFRQAADLLPPELKKEASGYRMSEAGALYRQGHERGDNPALQRSIAAFRSVLDDVRREQAPEQWADVQDALANALTALGEREGGTARLEEAAAAYRAALEAVPRERDPLRWALTESNLGTVLNTLGERESGTTLLEQAVAAHRAALEERTRERDPIGWATTQLNLGAALWALGQRQTATVTLEQAIAAILAASQ
ncbi:MAG TPA: hypothetical protein VE650_17920, partial [Acetobacteraceae bacterium]|nr:hypothetical protein [Acetobacteraceae bacterium]